SFPKLQARRLDIMREALELDRVAEEPGLTDVVIAAEICQGEPAVELNDGETVTLPAWLIEKGERVFRVRGATLSHEGIEEGDLLICQLRPKGRAASGELVIGKVGDNIYVGRWWRK